MCPNFSGLTCFIRRYSGYCSHSVSPDPNASLQRAKAEYEVLRNGRTAGITHPSLEGQRNTIVRAYAKAGLHPKDTCYVECHGTGTGVGMFV